MTDQSGADSGPRPSSQRPTLVHDRFGERRDWRIHLGLGITLAWLGLGAVYITANVGWRGFFTLPAESLGNFLEGAFAPLAFLWLVIGYFLQQKELAQNTDALRQQSEQIQRSAEQAALQTESQARSELNARQETFLTIARQVRGQLGTIAGMLFISSQGADEDGEVTQEEQSQLWTVMSNQDPEVFSRRLISLHVAMDEGDPMAVMALFYGTPIRARHSNNFVHTFDRLMKRAADCDPDGLITDSLLASGHGFLYRIIQGHQTQAPPEYADAEQTGLYIDI